MIDVVSGGVVARHLISNMVSNTQQFGIRGAIMSRVVNEVGTIDNLRLENQLTELTSPPKPKLVSVEYEPKDDSRVKQQVRAVPLPFPTQTVLARKSKNEDLLKMF
ncbi:hypothetical protein CR513_38695, partial [Mucuna pruriens]